MLGTLPHRTLHELAKKYGPIMSLRLGSVPTIVVSSPQAAELFLKTHDIVFASRPSLQFGKYLFYGNKGMGFTPYGPYWRGVRKFCTLELLNSKKIDSLAGMRREELVAIIKSLKDAAVAREVVDVSNKLATLVENMTYRMLFGSNKTDKFDNLKASVYEYVNLAGAFNLADYVPFLGVLDVQGLTRRMKVANNTIGKILEKIIDEHEQDTSCEHQKQDMDFIDVMLSLKNGSISMYDNFTYTFDRTNMKAILLDMVAGAIETSHAAIEWTLSELIRHPMVMKKLQQELKTIVGDHEMVDEIDLPNLEYLDMVVKESLRLHPVAPLLIPHESMEAIAINGYYIPKKARIIINAWSLARDSNVWLKNVEEFLPERFLGSSIGLGGRDFQLLPFGSGRRGCPGMHLGLINTKLVLAQLVHLFNWDLPNGMTPNELDMGEVFGLSLPRAKKLLAMPIYRM